MPQSPASHLASRHLWRTFWGGLALTPPLCLGVTLLLMLRGSGAADGLGLLRDFLSLTASVGLVALLPALFFCWLRRGAMRWLFGYYLARPGTGRRVLVVAGTLGLFVALVLASALVLYVCWRGYIEFWVVWRLCAGFSLPWLLAALGASWWGLRPPAASSVK